MASGWLLEKGEDDAVVPVAAGGSLSRLRVRRRMRSVLRFSPSTSTAAAAASLCMSVVREGCSVFPPQSLRVIVVVGDSGGSL